MAKKKRPSKQKDVADTKPKSSGNLHLFYWAIIIALPVLIYLNSFPGQFHYDDLHSIVENPSIRAHANIPSFFIDPTAFTLDPEGAMYRPLLLTTYALNFKMSGYELLSWHLVNLGLHILNVCLLFGLLKKLDQPDLPMLLAVLWFGTHALAGESVNYVSARSTLLVGSFFLGSLILFDSALRERSKAIAPALLCYCAALLSKESAIVFPAIVLLWDWLVHSPGRPLHKRFLRLHLSFWVISIFYLVLRLVLFSRVLSAFAPRGVVENLMTQARAMFHYLGLVLCPVRLSIHHQFRVSDSPLEFSVLIALAGLALILVLSIWLMRRREVRAKLGALSIAWFFVVLLPTSSIVPLTMPVNERRLYLPLAGLALGLMVFIKWLMQHGRHAKAVAVLVGLAISFNCVLVMDRNRVWQDDLVLWQEAFISAPAEASVRGNLAHALVQTGDIEGTRFHYQAAVRLRPGDARLWFYLGNSLEALGYLDEALEKYGRALELDPAYGEVHHKLALTYEAQGRSDLADAEFEMALAAGILSAEMYADLADRRKKDGRLEQAVSAYQRALELDNLHLRAMNNLGLTLDELGRYDQAQEVWTRALDLYPNQSSILMNLAQLALRANDPDRAEQYSEKIIRLSPEDPRGYFIKALAKELKGDYQAARPNFKRVLELDPKFVNAQRHLDKISSLSGSNSSNGSSE